MTECERWSTENCARDYNLTILTNDICTNQNLTEKTSHKILNDFEIPTDHPFPGGTLDLRLINQKKRTCHVVDFVIPADPLVKLKDKINKCMDLAWEMIKTVEHVGDGDINGNRRTWKSGKLGIRERIETYKAIVLLKSITIRRKVLETWRDYHWHFSEKPLFSVGVETHCNRDMWNKKQEQNSLKRLEIHEKI